MHCGNAALARVYAPVCQYWGEALRACRCLGSLFVQTSIITWCCMNSSRRTFLSLAAASILALTAQPGLAADKHYVFSAVPQFTPPQVFKEWQPVLNYLAADTGIEFELRTYDSIPQFEEAFSKGEVDFAYMNPYHAVMAKKAQGYVPLVRDSEELKGVLLARRDGPATVEELQGKVIGFPAPNAFGASLYMRALLIEQKHLKFDSRWLQTHSNVYRHVIAEEVAAGGSVMRALESEPPRVQEALKVIFETPGAAPHPLVAHPHVPAADREKVLKSLLAMLNSDNGRAMLKTIRMPGLIKADYARDYLPLEQLRLEKYVGGKE